MIPIFIGYDPNETVAYHVLSHSILSRSTLPVAITPVKLSQLEAFHRKRDPRQSTEFSFSRFMVPSLCNYSGMSIFVDCDMLCLGDITELLAIADPDKAVNVVKHDYTPKTKTKFLGNVQTTYEKKNWSSVMVFNNELCKALTPEYVNSASGLELHQFKWLNSDDSIGGLPLDWNHLVGEYEPNPYAHLIHFTLGTPCFESYRNCEYADAWFNEFNKLLFHRKEVTQKSA